MLPLHYLNVRVVFMRHYQKALYRKDWSTRRRWVSEANRRAFILQRQTGLSPQIALNFVWAGLTNKDGTLKGKLLKILNK